MRQCVSELTVININRCSIFQCRSYLLWDSPFSSVLFLTYQWVSLFSGKRVTRCTRQTLAPGQAAVSHLRTRVMHVLGGGGGGGGERTRIASNKTRRKWVDEHKSGTIGSVGRCPCGLGSGQWTPWPCETRAARVLHTVSHALPLRPRRRTACPPPLPSCSSSRDGLFLFPRPALRPFCTYATSTLGRFTRRNAFRAG